MRLTSRKIVNQIIVYIFTVIVTLFVVHRVFTDQHRDYIVKGLETNINYLESYRANNNKLDRGYLLQNAEIDLLKLKITIDKFFVSCDDGTKELIRSAKQYISPNKLPNCK